MPPVRAAAPAAGAFYVGPENGRTSPDSVAGENWLVDRARWARLTNAADFVNLVEVHVLDALRREHEIPLRKAREVLRSLGRLFPGVAHPLADKGLLTESREVFVEHFGRLVSASNEGQIAIREMLEAHLRRVDRDPLGRASRLYPFTRKREAAAPVADEPKLVTIDPEVEFGRPVLTGSGIPTLVIADRYKAGDSIAELAGPRGTEGQTAVLRMTTGTAPRPRLFR